MKHRITIQEEQVSGGWADIYEQIVDFPEPGKAIRQLVVNVNDVLLAPAEETEVNH